MKLHLLSIVLGISLLAGCTNPPAAAPAEETELLPAKGFVVTWKADLPLETRADRLYVADDYVFAYTDQNEVQMFNRLKGLPIFSGKPTLVGALAKPRVLFPPVVLREWVVFPAEEALSVYDRKGNWSHQYALRETMRSAAVGDDKATMYFLVSNGRIAEVRPDCPACKEEARLKAEKERKLRDVADLAERKRIAASYDDRIATVQQQKTAGKTFSLSEAIPLDQRGFNGTPCYFQNAVYIANRTGLVQAAAADDLRQALWTAHRETDHGFPTHGEVLADVKADSSGVFAASTDGQLYCLDINTGKIRWSYYAQKPLKQGNSPILTPDMLYLPMADQKFLAFEKNASDGPVRTPKWTIEAKQFLAQDDASAFFLGTDNFIWAVDKKTGKMKYTSRRNDFRLFATNLKDGTIYAISESGQLYAINAIKPPVPGVKPAQGVVAQVW